MIRTERKLHLPLGPVEAPAKVVAVTSKRIGWPSEFPDPKPEAWRTQAGKELRGKDPATLATRYDDGFALAPLQTPDDTAMLPHVRSGADALLRCRPPGFARRVRIVGPSPREAATQISRAIEDGIDEVELWFDPLRVRRFEPFEPEAGDAERGDIATGGVLADLPADVLDGDGILPEPRGLIVANADQLRVAIEPLRTMPARPTLALRGGAASPLLAASLVAITEQLADDLSPLAGLEVGYDPIGLGARGELESAPLDTHWNEAGDLLGFLHQHVPSARALAQDSTPFHQAGATPTQEVAALLCGATETLRQLSSGRAAALGHDPATIAQHLTFRVELGTKPLIEAAKVRALRLLWARILKAFGLDPVGDRSLDARVVGTTSSRCRARNLDLRTNIVRTQVQAFAGVTGGCDAVCTLPDVLDPAALTDREHAIARGQMYLMAEESQLGLVADPLGGSHTIERLTDATARGAWELLRTIESAGGFGATDGRRTLADAIHASATSRMEAFRRREQTMVGVSQFADPEREDVRVHDLRVLDAEQAAFAGRGQGVTHLEQLEQAPTDAGGTAFRAAVDACASGASFRSMINARRQRAPVPKPDEHGCPSAHPWPLRPGPGGDAVPFELPRLLARILAAAGHEDVHRVRVLIITGLGDDQKTARGRASFAEDLWRVSGARVFAIETTAAACDEVIDKARAAAAEHKANLACLCAPDDLLDQWAPALAERLGEGDFPLDLYVAAAPRPTITQSVSGFLHRGMDVVDFLDETWVEQLAQQASGAHDGVALPQGEAR